MEQYYKLKEGMIFANYIELCSFLEVDSLKGKSRSLHLNRMKEHFTSHNDGRKIIIDSINTGTILQLSHGYYAQDIQPLILCLLTDKYRTLGNDRIKMSMKQIAKNVGMFNDEYMKYAHRQSSLTTELDVTITDVSLLYNMYEAKVRYNVEYSLKDLSDRGYIKLQPILMQTYRGNNKQKNREIINPDEIARIKKVENDLLIKYGVKKKYDLHLNGKLGLYRRDLHEAINHEFKTGNILYHYSAYKISLNKDILYDEPLLNVLAAHKEEHWKSLNSKLVDKCLNYYNKSRSKAVDKLEFEYGGLNPYKRDLLHYKTTDECVINGQKLVNCLIKSDLSQTNNINSP